MSMLRGDKLQEALFNALCQEQVPVSVSLMNGSELEGQIASFDQYSILLKSPDLRLVYKHAIFSIVPSRDFKLPPELGPEPVPESKPKAAGGKGTKRGAKSAQQEKR